MRMKAKGRYTVHTIRERTFTTKIINDHNGLPAHMMFILGAYLRGSIANKLTLYFYVVSADRGAERLLSIRFGATKSGDKNSHFGGAVVNPVAQCQRSMSSRHVTLECHPDTPADQYVLSDILRSKSNWWVLGKVGENRGMQSSAKSLSRNSHSHRFLNIRFREATKFRRGH